MTCAVEDPFCGKGKGALVKCFRCGSAACLSCAIKWPVARYGRQWVCHDCAGALPDGIDGVRTHLSRLAGRLYNLEERRRVPVAAPSVTAVASPLVRKEAPPKKKQQQPLSPERPARARPYPKARMELLGYAASRSRA